MNRTHLAFSVLSLFAAAPLLAQGPVEQPASFAKQLAGPPSEIDSMRAPSPVDATIHSRSALLPVQLGANGWQGTLPVENGKLRFLVFSPAAADWQVELLNGSGRDVAAASLATRVIAFRLWRVSISASMLLAIDP